MTDLSAPGFPRLCYLEIPATDPRKSAEFYRSVFGWNIRRGDSDRPSFDDPSSLSGAFVTKSGLRFPGFTRRIQAWC